MLKLSVILKLLSLLLHCDIYFTQFSLLSQYIHTHITVYILVFAAQKHFLNVFLNFFVQLKEISEKLIVNVA